MSEKFAGSHDLNLLYRRSKMAWMRRKRKRALIERKGTVMMLSNSSHSYTLAQGHA